MMGEGRLRRETVEGFPLFVSTETRASWRAVRQGAQARAEGERRPYRPKMPFRRSLIASLGSLPAGAPPAGAAGTFA